MSLPSKYWTLRRGDARTDELSNRQHSHSEQTLGMNEMES